MAYKKINKEFCISDDSVNVYGYRLLTSGLKLDRFNPAIGFLMHEREKGIAVKWEDFRTETGKVFAKPVVNETLFPTLAQQIEDGFYGAASVGKIVALKTTEASDFKLEGQTGITVLEWFPRECSIVDIPGNYNAIAQLYDESDNILIDLSDNKSGKSHKNFKKMDEKEVIKLSDLKLPEGTTAAMAIQMFSDLADKTEKLAVATRDLADLKAAATREKVTAIIEKGKNDKKLTNEMAEKLLADYAQNPEGLKALVDAMPAQTLVTGSLSDKKVPEKYAGKTFRDLYLSGELAEVKKSFPEYYSELKKK
ncbi:MAG: phage protease [Prevotellaceae bacterium]|jgi:hypothetical protein|nr:phage protease [Prevotellaceae bacterium]